MNYLLLINLQQSPYDYAVEVASNAWFGSLVWPGAVGLVIGGPVGLAARGHFWQYSCI